MAEKQVLTNMSITAFKTAVGATTIRVLRNPHTGKLFASADNGQNFRVEAEIDPAKPMNFLVSDGNLDDACLINERTTIEAEFSL